MSRVTAWYVSISGKATGPVSTEMVKAMMRDGQISKLDLIFREGNTEWLPIASFSEFTSSTRAPKPMPGDDWHSSSALQDDLTPSAPHLVTWIVLKPHAGTYLQEGPFSTTSILEGLKTGRFQYSQYTWRAGLERWNRLGDLPEFDRRAISRTPIVPLPPPLPDPIEALLLESDEDDVEEFEVVVGKSDLTPSVIMTPPEHAKETIAESLGEEGLEGKTSTRVVAIGPDLASPSWETSSWQDASFSKTASAFEPPPPPPEALFDQAFWSAPTTALRKTEAPPEALGELSEPAKPDGAEPSEMRAQPVESAESVADVSQSGFSQSGFADGAPRIEIQTHSRLGSIRPPQLSIRKMDGWNSWGRKVAGVAMAALSVLFVSHAMSRRDVVPGNQGAHGAATSVRRTASTAASTSQSHGLPIAAPASSSPVPVASAPAAAAATKVSIVTENLDRSAMKNAEIQFTGTIPNGTTIEVSLRGKLGQIIGSMNVRLAMTLTKKSGETPSLKLAPLNLAEGTYTLEAKIHDTVVRKEFFLGTRDGSFIARLEQYLKEVSFETQNQKRELFYSVKTLDGLVRELAEKYGQLRTKPKQWDSFYKQWSAKLATVEKSIQELRENRPETMAYPDETAQLGQIFTSVREAATLYNDGMAQSRDIASDNLTDLIAELEKSRVAFGEVSARNQSIEPEASDTGD